MTLLLKYKGETSIPVEVEGLTPDWTRSQSVAAIERFALFHGNRQEPLAEFFSVSGDPSSGDIRIEGDCRGVHWIGAGMNSGRITVEGHAGRHLGSEMTGGEIRVTGNAGDWVGGEMHGGLIHVAGDAGHLVGAAYRGSRRGMTRGTIWIGGSVGNEAGHTMRRGTLVVGGNAGDCAGFNLIAGSIYIFGECGIRPGAGMRRGTIGLFGEQPPKLLPTFRAGCRFQPGFLRFTLLDLCRQGFAVPDRAFDRAVTLYHGDLVSVGKGEILLADG